jgi:hypothetical protein
MPGTNHSANIKFHLELSKSIGQEDGRQLAQELQELRAKSKTVDGLLDENEKLRTRLQTTLQELEVAKTAKPNNNSAYSNTTPISSKQTPNDYEVLIHKYDNVRSSFQAAIKANETVTGRLRIVKENLAKWKEYGGLVAKKLEQREAELQSRGLLDKRTFIRPVSETRDITEGEKGGPVSTPARARPKSGRTAPRSVEFTLMVSDFKQDILICTPEPSFAKTASSKRKDKHSIEPLPKQPISNVGIGQTDVDNGLPSPSLSKAHASDDSRQPSAELLLADLQAPLPMALLEESCRNVSSPPKPSSSLTQGDFEEPMVDQPVEAPVVSVKVESPESPVVLFSRSIHKRSHAEMSPLEPKVKVESAGSSPTVLSSTVHVPEDEMDLDDIGQKVATPKRRRSSRSGGTTADINHRHKADPDIWAIQSSPIPRKRQVAKPVQKKTGSVLLDRSPNKQILPWTSNNGPVTKRQRMEERVGGAMIFSEGGENENASPEDVPRHASKLKHVEPEIVARRLGGLLDHPSPERNILTPNRLKRPTKASPFLRIHQVQTSDRISRSQPETPHIAARRNGAGSIKKNVGSKALPATKIPDIATDGYGPNDVLCHGIEDEDGPENEPFRCRPLSSLELKHFKISPDYNQGYNYAFKDVVRGREQRKCLPGCTKPECCGTAFRKLAELTRSNVISRPSQEEEDELLLQEYLGDNIGQLETATEDERAELLIQAKTRELANKHGKHRHAFERRKSPPGFWRTDFPTTQEQLQDRAEAAKTERDLVQKRYNEAMRGGGQWMFRDE